MRRGRRIAIIAAIGALGWILSAELGCTSDPDSSCTGDMSPSGEECSTGDPYPAIHAFEHGSPTDARHAQCHACTPHCNGRKYSGANIGGHYLTSALPSGACSNDGVSCDMEAVDFKECANGFIMGCALSGFRCRCSDGAWSCFYVAQGAGACPPCPEDLDAGVSARDASGTSDVPTDAGTGQ
jgi:hypothetical protein